MRYLEGNVDSLFIMRNSYKKELIDINQLFFIYWLDIRKTYDRYPQASRFFLPSPIDQSYESARMGLVSLKKTILISGEIHPLQECLDMLAKTVFLFTVWLVLFWNKDMILDILNKL
jgi:hypothetical protein